MNGVGVIASGPVIRRLCAAAFFLLIITSVGPSAVQAQEFANFEVAQTNSVRLSPDGSRLFAVNTPAGSLSVFDATQATAPVLIAEIPVGLGPVSVSARNNNEAWVVNQVSDSVSIQE